MSRFINGIQIIDNARFATNVETLSTNKTLVISDYVNQWLDPNGSDRDVTLPAEASSLHLTFIILNTANALGEDLVIKNDAAATLITIGPDQSAILTCDGTNWKVENDDGIYYDGQATSAQLGHLFSGGAVVPGYLTVGQSSLNTSYSFYNAGGVSYFASDVLNAGKFKASVFQALYSNDLSVALNVAVTSGAATHSSKLQIDDNDIIVAQATGDGAGGIDSDSKKAIITGQLQGDLTNNQIVSKMVFDILGLTTDIRGLWCTWPDPSTTSAIDSSPQGHDGTYYGTMTSGDRIMKAMGWALDPDGIDDYIDLGDSDDFSFGDGTNDYPVTWFGVIEVTDSAAGQIIISKYDGTTSSESREWFIILASSENLYLFQYDESANVYCARSSNAAISIGYHSFVITSPGGGGATAMDNVKMYIDGSVVASTATNDSSYVAMENTITPVKIGTRGSSGGVPELFMNGDIGLIGIDGREWSALDAFRFNKLTEGVYGL